MAKEKPVKKTAKKPEYDKKVKKTAKKPKLEPIAKQKVRKPLKVIIKKGIAYDANTGKAL
jgi:hypothetical protein